MSTALKIEDFDDPTFNPFATVDRMQGFEDIDDPYPRFHALHRKGTVLKGDVRREFGLQQLPVWANYPSWMVLGYDAVYRAFSDGAVLSNSVKQRFYDISFGKSIDGMDGAEADVQRILVALTFFEQQQLFVKTLQPLGTLHDEVVDQLLLQSFVVERHDNLGQEGRTLPTIASN